MDWLQTWFQSAARFVADYAADFADSFVLNFIKERRYMLLVSGLGVTLQVTLGAAFFGLLLGILVALARISKVRWINRPATLYVTVIRGTPLLIQLMIIYYIIFQGTRVSSVLIAILAFSFNSAAYVGEIIRAGIQAVDRGQTEASRSLGLNHVQTMISIVLPQAFRNILPALCNEVIALMKETSIVGYIALRDLTKSGDIIRSRTFDAFMPLMAVALIYLTLTTVLGHFFGKLERRLRNSDSHP